MKGDRFRLASSYIQPIVNEIYFRVPSSKVDWETDDIKKFEYGNEAIVITTKVRLVWFSFVLSVLHAFHI